MKKSILNMSIAMLILFLSLTVLRMFRQEQAINEQNLALEARQMDRLTPLMNEKRRLDEELAALRKEISAGTQAPSSVAVLLDTDDEAVIAESAALLDEALCPGLIAVRVQQLTQWRFSGVPEWLIARIAAGWEICLAAESAAGVPLMQEALAALSLPPAAAVYLPENAYTAGDASLLEESGVRIVLHADAGQHSPDGLWHIPAIGNMNSGALSLYNATPGTGGGAVFVIGGARTEDSFQRDNLKGLLDLYRRDLQAGRLHALPLADAFPLWQAHTQRVNAQAEDWQQREAVLIESIGELNERIQMITPQ